jgi:hypothetical protein
VSVAQAAEVMGLPKRWFYARVGAPFMHRNLRGYVVDLAALVIPGVEMWLAEAVQRLAR